MRIGFLDCFAGVSGDMWVGALLDLGVPLAELAAAVDSMALPGVSIRSENVLRAGLHGVRFAVELHGREPGRALEDPPVGASAGVQFRPASAPAPVAAPGAVAHGPHRGLGEIQGLLRRAALPGEVRDDALQVFEHLARVEARAHATTVDAVHFHEVGAEDTIVDVVCACLGTHRLGLQRLCASAVTVGSGTVRTAHGLLPVPAPATLDLLAGMPVRAGAAVGERTTPTGAALLRVLVDDFEPQCVWVPGARGHGAGTRDDPALPNLLRLAVGELRAPNSATSVCELTCQVDTATGEAIGWLLDEALRRGALDAFAQPVLMKKGRPGFLLTLLCDDARADALVALLLEESTTLGVRRQQVARAVLERWPETRSTPLGPVRCKVARLPSGRTVVRAEDDELRRLAAEHGLGRAEVLRRLAEALGDAGFA